MPILIHVDAYSQDRDGAATSVRAHVRSAPGAGGGARPPAAPVLTAEQHSANGRLARALARTGDFSGILPILTGALDADGERARIEVVDLIAQTDARLPGHGQKLKAELRRAGYDLAPPGGAVGFAPGIIPVAEANGQSASGELIRLKPQIDTAAMQAEIDDAQARKRHLSNKADIGSKQCVALVKRYREDLGSTKSWRAGSAVAKTTTLEAGDAIAHGWDQNGEYPSNSTGNHAAIIQKVNYDKQGRPVSYQVADQASNYPVRVRTMTAEELGNKGYRFIVK